MRNSTSPEIELTDGNFGPRANNIPAHATAVIEIDLRSLTHNYAHLQSIIGPNSTCSAVLKSNAYGLGIGPISLALWKSGCKNFYVATLDEAITLRSLLPDSTAHIYMLNGLLNGMEYLCRHHNIIPVLNSQEQIILWSQYAAQNNLILPASLHFDTGLNRLGIDHLKAPKVAASANLSKLSIQYIMSHLSCSDQSGHSNNNLQLRNFKQVMQSFPTARGSLCNSHAILLGSQYHFQQVRPGRSLYGVASRSLNENGIRQAVRIYTKILQTKSIPAGATVGYNATYKASRDTKIAILAMGYADGILRTRTHEGVMHISGHPATIIGRISMDLVAVDISNVPEKFIYDGAWVEYVGDYMSFDDAAEAAGTISHEILVNTGTRYFRSYMQ